MVQVKSEIYKRIEILKTLSTRPVAMSGWIATSHKWASQHPIEQSLSRIIGRHRFLKNYLNHRREMYKLKDELGL